jgi:hypothetical protein
MMLKLESEEMLSRRGVFSLLGLGAVLGLAVPTTVLLTTSEAEAETVGMERRENRRGNRQQRRQDRRSGY